MPGSASEDAEPSKVTAAPDATLWSVPALATGMLFAAATVTVVLDADELALPSFTVRLKTKAPAAVGAVNVGLMAEAEERVTGVPEV